MDILFKLREQNVEVMAHLKAKNSQFLHSETMHDNVVSNIVLACF